MGAIVADLPWLLAEPADPVADVSVHGPLECGLDQFDQRGVILDMEYGER